MKHPPLRNRTTGIKSLLLTLVLLLPLLNQQSRGALILYEPQRVTLPDGTIIKLFVSGDEFFNWMHDTLGLPVKQGQDGYYYYMLQNDSLFTFTGIRAGNAETAQKHGVKPVVFPSNVAAKREAFYTNLGKEDEKNSFRFDSKYTGTFSNLVIYIRFSDQTEFTTPRSTYESRLNSLSASSVRHYYREVSYNKVDMISYHYPGGTTENISYTDIYPRDYFRPYDATTNPQGYATSSEKTSREHSLLARAVKFINDNYTKPEGVNFDTNNDGNFENVAFIIRGSSDGWSDLLWPHRWSLYSTTANLWGKRVYGYTFQLENVSVKTFTHEMFHAIGAPDLYHYTSDGISPAGVWDLMQSGGGHMLAWMKYRYGGWISAPTEISSSGTYTLLPLTSPDRNCFKIASPFSTNQFFIIEFRKKTGLYEGTLPSSGIIIYRIDTRYRGNANGPPDEVYVYRPGGTPTANGSPNSATFSDLLGRTLFNQSTDPYPFLQDGSPGGLWIKNIKSYTDSMTFTLELDMPTNLAFNKIDDSGLGLSWNGPEGRNFLVAVSSSPETFNPVPSAGYTEGDPIGVTGSIVYKGSSKNIIHSGLGSDELYHYTIWTIIDEAAGIYSNPLKGSVRTAIHTVTSLPYSQDFSAAFTNGLPRGWKAEGGSEQFGIVNEGTYSEPLAVSFKNMGSGAEWFYTPGFELSNQEKYLITLRYRSALPGYRESLLLFGGSSRHSNGLLENKIFSDVSVTYSDYVLLRAVFRPQMSGIHYFGLRAAMLGKGVIADDFRIEKVPGITKNISEPAGFFPNPSTGKITVPVKEKTTISVCNADGRVVYTKTIEGTTEIDISHLGTGFYILKFSGSKGESSARLVLRNQTP